MLTIMKMAIRNLFRNPRRTIIVALLFYFSAITLLINISGANGISKLMIDSAKKLFTGDIQVSHKDTHISLSEVPSGKMEVIKNSSQIQQSIVQIDGVDIATERISYGVILSNENSSRFASILGIDPENEIDFSGLKLKSGRMIESTKEILATETILSSLNLSLNDRMYIYSSTLDGFFNGMEGEIVGIVEDTNFKFMRENTVLVLLEDAQQLLGFNDFATHIVIKQKQGTNTNRLVTHLNDRLSSHNCKAEIWSVAGKEIRDSQVGVVFSLVFLYVVSVFIITIIIFNTMIIIIYERFREIGTLLAIGFDRLKVIFLIVFEGLFLGVFSGLAGTLSGYILIQIFKNSGIEIGPDFAFIFGGTVLYPDVSLFTSLLIALSIGIFGGISALIPSLKVRTIQPSDALVHI